MDQSTQEHSAQSNTSGPLTTTCAALVHICTALQPRAYLLHTPCTCCSGPRCMYPVVVYLEQPRIPGEPVHGRLRHTLKRTASQAPTRTLCPSTFPEQEIKD